MDVRVSSGELERLYRERFVGFKRALATITGSYDSAEDALQEAFVKALRALPSFRGEAPLAAWLWQIAYRTALDQRRAGARHEFTTDAGVDGVAPELVVRGHDSGLVAALQQLPERRRLIVFLRYFADCSYAEIGVICGISEGTVAASLAQARAALAGALQAEASVAEPKEVEG